MTLANSLLIKSDDFYNRVEVLKQGKNFLLWIESSNARVPVLALAWFSIVY